MNLYLYFTVHGVEYAFGAHDYPTSGVFEVEPRQCPGFKFRKSIFIGTTSLDPVEVREFMECESANYNGDTYHLIAKNCNHFCKDICYKLTGKSIPTWVNRLARLGILLILLVVDFFGVFGWRENHFVETSLALRIFFCVCFHVCAIPKFLVLPLANRFRLRLG